jgi:isoleucyl-tRNA synthetase
MYTTKADSLERRSGQTAMYEILNAMVKLMAPILSFTAEECWSYLADDGESVHLQDFPEVNSAWLNDSLDERWARLMEIRGEILKNLEIARKEKVIGHSLDSLVEVYASGDSYTFLSNFEAQLDDICIISAVALYGDDTPVPEDAVAGETTDKIHIRIAKAPGEKCPRCWHYRTTIGDDPEYPEVCAQCAAALH